MSTIYLDMDGVIADFFAQLAAVEGVNHWKSITDKEIALAKLRNTDFFYNIPMFKNTGELLHGVSQLAKGNGMPWGICSSPLKNDTHNSAYHKRRWLELHGIAQQIRTEDIIFTSNKYKYAISPITHRPNILVDDRPQNIRSWEKAGGIGIRYQADEDDLEEYLFERLEQAIDAVWRS